MNVNFPEDLVQDALVTLEKARTSGKIKKGTNEVTKAIERGLAKLVYIGGDVQPQEIIRHLPILAKEKNIPYIIVPESAALGTAAGIEVASASTAIVDGGEAAGALPGLIDKVRNLN
jgi:large subunit ribosomal protein L7Ae